MVCSAAAVVTAVDAAEVRFVESGYLAMTQMAVLAGHMPIAVWSLGILVVTCRNRLLGSCCSSFHM